MIVLPPAEQTESPATADIHGMREHNTALVVRALWQNADGLSRADLARHLGLSRSTISAIVQGLLATGIILESHRARSTGGRRPIVLKFNDEHLHVLGLDLGSSHLTIARTDLRGRVLARSSVQHDVQNDPEGTLQLIDSMLRELVPATNSPLLGLGIAVPCPVDADSRHQLSPRILPAWRGVQLGSWLHDEFGLPVYMDNDANMGALAEAWWGAGRGFDHFAYIKVGTGVGAGYIIDTEPYRGASGIAGEIGHTTVHAQGRRCRCGLRGCLEAEIGSPALVSKAREAIQLGAPTSLAEIPSLDLAGIIQQALDGDAIAGEIIEEAGQHLGVAVANLLNLLNPGRVVLGGRLTVAGDLLLDPLRATVRERALSTSIDRAEIVLSALGEDHIAIGASTLVVQQALQDPQRFLSPRTPGLGASGFPTPIALS